MSIIAEYGTILLILACLFGFFMAWGVGANDVANAMGTSVGSQALTIRQAIIIAICLEFLGAYLAGGSVTDTIRKGIIDPDMPVLLENPQLLVYGMMAALLAAGTWLLVATHYGWPVSTTHSIVGAIVGFAAVSISVDAVNWGKVSSIVASWVISPIMSGFIAFMIFMSVQKLILDSDNPFRNAKRYVPIYMFLVGFMMAMVTLIKGLKHIGLPLDYQESILLSLLIGLLVMLAGKMALSKIKEDAQADKAHFQCRESLWCNDDFHRLLHGVCPRLQRCCQRSRPPGRSGQYCYQWRRNRRQIRRAKLGTAAGSQRHCGGSGHLWLQSHGDHRYSDH